MPEPTTQQERETSERVLFEAALTKLCEPGKPDFMRQSDGDYVYWESEWSIWQAARSLPPTDAPRVRELQQDGWIDVRAEQKPEFGVVILLWVHAENEGEDDDGRPFSKDDSQVQMGQYRDDGHGPYFDSFATPFADHEGVTHWRPMPAPPAAIDSARKESSDGQ